VRARPKCWPIMRVAVAENSMVPALRPGDWLLAWRTRRVRPGQVVLAIHPGRPGFLLVKRVAWWEEGAGDVGRQGGWGAPGGMAGARGDGGREPPMREVSPPSVEGTAGGWWLASDNPGAGAVDSARFGPVPAEKIVARVLLRYWPIRRRG
jgi:hypothetical protein